jgi:enoyl-CoA hydratase/carnithine racemase
MGHSRPFDERARRNLDHELEEIVKQTSADAAVKGVVITSGKEAFSAGADLSMLEGMAAAIPRTC